MSLDPVARRHPWLFGADWEAQRLRQLGWRLMPLRVFLGGTFTYASLQKLANPAYLRASSPSSVVSQMKALDSSSPIGPLLRLSLHAPTLVGLLIAIGELAVALGVLTGMWIRLAAVGGMLLSLTFFLTVSWATTPYYYGSDIVFVFAWSVFATCGAAGVVSIDAWIASRAAATPAGATPDANRRQILIGARAAALLAVFGGVLGGATAAIGRAAGGSRRTTRDALQLTLPSQTTTASAAPSATVRSHAPAGPPSPTHSASGTALAALSAVPVGQGRRFNDPRSGQPAWVVRPSSSQVVAFTATCTHAGCTVGFDAGELEFVCPCHGGRYNAKTGQVVSGPPPRPLTAIPVHVVDNEIRVD